MQFLGEFYREKILSQKKLKEIEFPRRDDEEELKIVQELFDWKIYAGKRYLSCTSEEEARYLKLFWEIGLTSIKIPRDKEYLKSILPDLELLKQKHQKILDDELAFILRPKKRRLIEHRFWMEIMFEDAPEAVSEENDEEELEDEETEIQNTLN